MTLLKAVAGFFNDTEDTIKEEYYLNRQATASLVGQISRRSDVHIDALTQIEQKVDNSKIANMLKRQFGLRP